MKTNRDAYSAYTPEVVLKRVMKYVFKRKTIILLSMLFLIFYTILELFQPVLVSELLDDHLNGIQTIWVVNDSGNVEYRGKKLQKVDTDVINQWLKEKEQSGAINVDDQEYYSLIYFEKGYYLFEDVFFKSEITTIPDYMEKLTQSELDNFFQPEIPFIWRFVILYAILTVLISVFRFFENIFFQTASMRLTYDMRVEAFEKLNRLPINYFSREPSGKIVTKIISDSEGVRGLYSVIFQIIAGVVSLIMIYIALFRLNLMMALISLAITPLILVWMTIYRKVNNMYHHRIREMNSVINASLAQYVDGMMVIQQFNQEDVMRTEYDELLKKNYGYKMRSLKINSIFGGELLSFLQNILIAVVIFFVCRNIMNEKSAMTSGTLYIYIVYVGKLIDPILTIFNNLNGLEDSFVASSRIFEFLDQTEDKYLGKGDRPEINGDVEFKNITFSYVEGAQVLKDVSLKANAGDFIGLVGHTGSGKSTLMVLLQRFYDLQDGEILIDNENFMRFSKQEIRSTIGYVLQDPAIFEGTIKSNILMSSKATDEEIYHILDLIGAKKFITEFSEGINTKVEYLGSNLSTGEKQLISFARILLRDPAILILDEATANIDSETEALIQKALTVLAKNRTTFVVAHRLSTIKNATCIYVLADGKIIEAGTHEELYNRKGSYRQMYDAQYHNEK